MSLARAIGRNTLHTAVARFAVLFVWFLVTPRVLEALGPDRFGFWAILLVLTGSLATLDLGLGVAVTRFSAELAGRGALRGAMRLILKALALQCGFALVLVLPALLLREPLLRLFHVPAAWLPEARATLPVALAAFVAGGVANLFTAALMGLQRMDLAARATVGPALLLLVAVPIACGADQPLRAIVLVQAGYALLMAGLFALAVWAALRTARVAATQSAGATSSSSSSSEEVPFPRLLALGSWIQAITVLALIQAHLDKLLLGALVALGPVGAYEIAHRVAGVAFLAPVLYLGALLPAIAHREAQTDVEERPLLYRLSLEPLLVGTFGLAAALFALGPALLEAWLSHPPEGSVFILRCLSVAGAATFATGAASTIVRAAERVHVETTYHLVNTVLHVSLALLGLRLFGWPGILYGTALAAVLSGLGFVAWVERELGLGPLVAFARASLPALAASLVAGVLGSTVLWLLRDFEPGRMRGLLALASGGAVFTLAFVLVLARGFPATWKALSSRGLAWVRA